MIHWQVAIAITFGFLLGSGGVFLWSVMRKSVDNSRNLPEISAGKALLALVEGNTDLAMKQLAELVNYSTDNVDAYMALSNLYRDKGWFHRSIDIRRRLLSRGILDNERRRAIMIGMVTDYQKAGLHGRAINAMKTIIEMVNASSEDYELLAGLLEHAGRFDEAAEAWKKAGNQENYAFARTEIAKEMIVNNDWRSAYKHLVHTLRIDRKNPAALMILADLTGRMGKIRQMEKLFDRLQEIRPDLTGVIADTLETIAADTQNEKTQQFFIGLLEKQCHRPRVAVRFAAYLTRLNRTEEARRIVRSIQTDELAPEMMARLVEVANECGEIDAAARYGLETIRRFLDSKAFRMLRMQGTSILSGVEMSQMRSMGNDQE